MKLLIALLLSLLAAPSYAACTWASNSNGAQGSCDTTPVAPTSTDGMSLDANSFWSTSNVKAISVIVETAGTMTAGGVLQAYVKNPISGTWVRVADGSLDLFVAAVANQGFTGIYVPVARGRIAYVASGLGVASTIYITAAY
jgi:hypothetical protein